MKSHQLLTAALCIFISTNKTFADKIPELNANITRIVGGSVAQRGEFPFIVQISYKGRPLCGGSIVNKDWIVTAAHCTFRDIAGYTITAGEHDLRVKEGSEQSRTITRAVTHPNYNNRGQQENDVAVWRVNTPFTFDKYVQPISFSRTRTQKNFGNQLGQLGQQLFQNYVVAAGWGQLSFQGISSPLLMKVTLRAIPTPICNLRFLGRLTVGLGRICAQASGGDTCQGDSGGPLVRGNTLIGITSVGIGCNSGYPGVYTDVPYYSSWINAEIAK